MPDVTPGRPGWSEPVMTNLIERLESATEHTDRGVRFLCEDPGMWVSWADLHAEALQLAGGLRAHGVGEGDHVALLGPTSRALVTTIRAVWLVGATVVVLPLPMRMSSLEAFVAQTRGRVLDADVKLLVIDEQLAPFVDERPGDPQRVTFADLEGAGADDWVRPRVDPGRLAILQYTSGSTSDPKGVMLPEHTLLANLDALTRAGRLDQEGPDVFVSWLPLYHDMGLVGMLTTAMTTGHDLVLAAPQDFMASPSNWVHWLSDHGGTLTAAPNFAYVLASRALERLEGLDLSRLRLAVNGAEPVDVDGVRRFIRAGARHGLRPECVFPAFGMAEVGIAGTFGEPLTGLRTDTVDLRVLETERYAAPVAHDAEGTKTLARLGRPVPGLQMRIVDPDDGRVMAEREVGELQLRGTSLTPGYYHRPDVNSERFVDGWLRTGDLAYVVDGELVVCGRLKDLIIVGGRNVFPEDVEVAVAELAEVRSGNVIAFGCEAGRRPGLVVVAETRSDALDELRAQVAGAVKDAVGLAAREIVLVPAGTLPKTSSGKLQRSLCRTRYLADEYTSVATAS